MEIIVKGVPVEINKFEQQNFSISTDLNDYVVDKKRHDIINLHFSLDIIWGGVIIMMSYFLSLF